MTTQCIRIAPNLGIIKTSQPTANRLGNCRLSPFRLPISNSQHHEYTTDGGTAYMPELLHPECRNGGCSVVTQPIKILKSIHGYSSHIDNGAGEPLCGKFKNRRWKSQLGMPTCMFCERAVEAAPLIAAYRKQFARKPKKGQVYLISALGLNRYKIGSTIDLEKRLLPLQSFSPVPLEVLTVIECSDIERAEVWLHKKFASCRHHSEWFDLSASDVEWIMSLTSLEEGSSDAF